MTRNLFAPWMPLSLLLAASGASACDVEMADEEIDQPDATEIARAVTEEGAIWRFLEPAPGELVVWVTADESDRDAFRRHDPEKLSYTQLYERLSGEPAPAALERAQARSEALARAIDPSESDDEVEESSTGTGQPGTEGGVGQLSQQISATDFQSDYCGSVSFWDYVYCWPSFYGSPYVQRKVYSMYGYVAAVNNTITFRMRYKTVAAGSWNTLVSAQALPGQVHYVYQTYFGYTRWRRWEVLDNGDNLVRYSVYGSE